MSWLRFLRRKRSDAELQDEIEAFLIEETADNVARGMSPDAARRQARVKLGNPQQVRESLWMQNSPLPLTHIGHDLNAWASSFELRKPDWKVMITEMFYDPQAKQIYFRRSSDALDDLSV